ncbi:MAG: Nif11-like leader peptide family natural product precursor [Flavobacteriales bacterium]
MALKDAIQFFNKIQKEDSFRKAFEMAQCLSVNELLLFANKHQFYFTNDEFEQAFQKNYEMRWMLMVGMQVKEK